MFVDEDTGSQVQRFQTEPEGCKDLPHTLLDHLSQCAFIKAFHVLSRQERMERTCLSRLHFIIKPIGHI